MTVERVSRFSVFALHKFLFIHHPRGALVSLHSLEIFVKRQIVSDGILKKRNLNQKIFKFEFCTFHVTELFLKYVDLSLNQL